MSSENKKVFYALAAVMLLFWLGRLLQGDYRLADSDEYLQTALLIKNGGWFTPASQPESAILLTKRPFLYPLWLLITGPASDGFIAFLQNIFGLFTLYLAVKLYDMKGGNRPLFLFLLILFTPSVFIYTHLLMTEVIVASLITLLAVLCFTEYSRDKFIGIQIVIGLLPFLKPVFYPFVFINFIYWFFLFLRKRKTILLISVVPVMLVLLYMGFNRYRTGYFHFSSIQTINLVNYNLYFYEVKENGYDNAEQVRDSLEQKAEGYQTFAGRSHFLEKSARKIILKNLPSYAIYHTEGALRGIFDPGRFDLATFLPDSEKNGAGFLVMLNKSGPWITIKKIIQSPEGWLFFTLILILLAQLVKWLFIGKYAWSHYHETGVQSLFFCLFVAFIILITGPLNASRFMMPFEPVLSVFAALAIAEK